ncbi:Rv1815 family serine proteinase [Mycolicibacterium goodii]|uniref:S1 family peptidase n=1 Tax=Mycolicibacterium goodii TaxID=134601 RepID=A0ABS6HUJ3_MYCGD|nr:hypothetical protein [Mycolicibacterium goodii]OKH61329.1 hypothetical protein EB74_20725 [Mycobacterium sp. SWH-M5]MBU8813424.1 S1 family peptidase [Mycolicibacterium goodii]MBU8819790.1 S1 family peptidase [Mycolicibacterium goodii]MBU8825971.1 S1 family peptidase [Mycolicibacterium goodii]MBU8832184.1 S1 family peptidase [Mycolicibacterium goodii]
MRQLLSHTLRALPVFLLMAALSAWPSHADPGVQVFPGMEIRQDNNVCTIGFVDPVARVAFTAGHCRGSGSVGDRNGNFIGVQAAFHDNTPNGATVDTNHVISDWETIQLTGDVGVNPALPTGRILVEDPAVGVAPGMPVCHFGVVTGESCGAVEAVNNGWFTMANGVVSARGDSGGPVYTVMPDGRAVIVGLFNSTWGQYPAAVSWPSVSGQARHTIVQASADPANLFVQQP